MIILGIETSCDETACSVVKDGTEILSNVVTSSAEMHAKTGGIIPEKAAREQIQSIIPVVEEALLMASGVSNSKRINPWIKDNIDAIAVTVGPGLIGSLLVGVETAKTLSHLWDKPIIPINHLLGHVYANWLTWEGKTQQPDFPLLCLLVSGGHTDLVLMTKHNAITWIGGTRDDAAGEAFDKCARLMGLPYPGGPSIAAAAEKFNPQGEKLDIRLPRPMLDENNFDWSFSGLKTAVLREVEKLKSDHKFDDTAINQLSYEVQKAIAEVLVTKTLKAVDKYQPKCLLLAGGVAANSYLKEAFEIEIKNSKLSVDFIVPPSKLCTDNAAYIAGCAFFSSQGDQLKPIPWQEITTNPELTITTEV